MVLWVFQLLPLASCPFFALLILSILGAAACCNTLHCNMGCSCHPGCCHFCSCGPVIQRILVISRVLSGIASAPTPLSAGPLPCHPTEMKPPFSVSVWLFLSFSNQCQNQPLQPKITMRELRVSTKKIVLYSCANAGKWARACRQHPSLQKDYMLLFLTLFQAAYFNVEQCPASDLEWVGACNFFQCMVDLPCSHTAVGQSRRSLCTLKFWQLWRTNSVQSLPPTVGTITLN